MLAIVSQATWSSEELGHCSQVMELGKKLSPPWLSDIYTQSKSALERQEPARQRSFIEFLTSYFFLGFFFFACMLPSSRYVVFYQGFTDVL